MHLTISNDIVSTKNYDKHDDFDFEIIMVMFLALHPMESISLNSLIRASSHVADFNRFQRRKYLVTYKPRHELSNNVLCATSKASDQPAHTNIL